MKKYEFTGETKETWWGADLHRIRAVTTFGDVESGELGGWIEKEENLSHKGTSWVYGNAEVGDDAKVYGNGRVFGDAMIFGNAQVYDNAMVRYHAKVYDDAVVCGNAMVYSYARVYGNARVLDDTEVYGGARIYGDVKLFDGGVVCDNAEIFGNACVCGNAKVCGDAVVCGNATVCGDAKVYGVVKILGNANVSWNAEVFYQSHILVIGAIGSRGDFTTFYRDSDNDITVKCGCFCGKIEDFLEKVSSTHGISKHALIYRAAVGMAKLQIDLTKEDRDSL